MGKDAKIIWTKDGLKTENLKLARKQRDLDMSYREVRSVFTQLERDYDNSYGAFPFQRYGMLKGMIKHAVCTENLCKAEALVKKGDKKSKTSISGLLGKAKELAGREEPAPRPSAAGNKGMGGLLAACKMYAGKADDIEFGESKKKDLSEMSKKEVAEDNDAKRRQLDDFDDKFLRAFNRLEQLKSDYESSKGSFPLTRYSNMKTMIKDVAKDKGLR